MTSTPYSDSGLLRSLIINTTFAQYLKIQLVIVLTFTEKCNTM
nr:MAG TPA: hypothetical protein [Caudoviricetes sp.]